jgi:hypothetical protein
MTYEHIWCQKRTVKVDCVTLDFTMTCRLTTVTMCTGAGHGSTSVQMDSYVLDTAEHERISAGGRFHPVTEVIDHCSGGWWIEAGDVPLEGGFQ